MKKRNRITVLAGLATIAWSCTSAQPERPAAPAPPPTGARGGEAAVGQQDSAASPRGGGAGGAAAQPRPYARVITAEARTVNGLFKAHRVGERLYFEIPRNEYDKDMLILSRSLAGGGGGAGFGGGGTQINLWVHWEREGNRVFLRRNTYDVAADPSRAISQAVDAMRYGGIIAAFNIEAWGPDSAAVIDVTRLFTTNIAELYAIQNPQNDRSFVESVAAYPATVNVVAVQTAQQTPQPAAGGRGGGGGGGAAGGRPQTVTVRQHYSLYKLPEQPMMPRLHDKRIGFNSIQYIDYSRPEHQARTVRFIRRFRLEKRNPNAEISDPVQPIVFWIDPATPEWLVPWIKRGVDAWQPAFREAGFSNGIMGRVAPTAEEDPNWSMYDARHSMVYWRPSTTANATGGQVADPRSGEIIKAEVNMYHNVMNLVRNWYFTQVGPLDPRAQSLPLPDSLMGRLVEYVVTHEVGHAIGYPHNMKASAMYPADSVRSASFLRRMGGHVATLMDYSRYNYVAQPEDNIPVDMLVPGVGPYDRYVVMWGHKPIPGARRPEDEWPTLDRWSRMQDTIPWYRFTTEDSPNDPYDQTEAVGDQDAVKSSGLGMRNLKRVADMLLKVAEKPGEDYTLLEELYGNVVSQWGRYNGHVASIIGSAETQERYGTGRRFQPTSRQRQEEAVTYLAQNAFRVPAFILNDEILFRIQAEGQVARIRQAQAGVLNSLFNVARMNRLVEYEALQRGGTAYTLADLLGDTREAVWTELSAGTVRVDVYRRNLQRAYLEALDRLLNPPPPAAAAAPGGGGPGGGGAAAATASSDVRPAVRGHLVELDRAVESAIAKAGDGMTRLHLRDVRMEIERMLDPTAR
jgi:hypothetical protein